MQEITAFLPSHAVALRLCSRWNHLFPAIISFTHFFVLTWDFFFDFKEDFVSEKFTLVTYAPSLPTPWSLSFLIAYVSWLGRKATQSEISVSCVYLPIHLYDHYTWDLLWALTALGTFYVCNHFPCTFLPFSCGFYLLRFCLAWLGCSVRPQVPCGKRSGESGSPVLSQRKASNLSPLGTWPEVIRFSCRGPAFWS